jgi:hypothetical protein
MQCINATSMQVGAWAMNVRISPRGPGPTTHPLSHHAINPNITGQQQHSVNRSDGRTGVRQQPVDSSDENGDIIRGY